jgi:hypothetical protein
MPLVDIAMAGDQSDFAGGTDAPTLEPAWHRCSVDETPTLQVETEWNPGKIHALHSARVRPPLRFETDDLRSRGAQRVDHSKGRPGLRIRTTLSSRSRTTPPTSHPLTVLGMQIHVADLAQAAVGGLFRGFEPLLG